MCLTKTGINNEGMYYLTYQEGWAHHGPDSDTLKFSPFGPFVLIGFVFKLPSFMIAN